MKKSLDARASNLHQRIIQSQLLLVTPAQIKGCSSSEITKIEQTYNLSLPYSYKVFLRHFGHGMGRIATDLEFLYPSPLSLTQYMRNIDREIIEEGDFNPEELLPENAFIFAMKYRMEAWYFLTEESVENPAIFYDEGNGNSRQVHESIFDFWETEVEYIEKILAGREERERQKPDKEDG